MPKAPSPPGALRSAFEAKLAESGLTPADARALGFEVVPDPRALGLRDERPGFRIPYHDASGSPTGFWRFRALAPAPGVAGQTALPRYLQPPGTVNEPYLAPGCPWASIPPAMPIIITEGELKAACACKHGLLTVGLGGVWCWKASRAALDMLPALRALGWQGRPVTIVYDSDAATNPMVLQAEVALADALAGMGATVSLVRLPAPGGAKVGLDDYLVAHGREAFEALPRLPFNDERALYRLNSEVVYVRDPGLVLRLDTLQRMQPQGFVTHAFANRTHAVQTQKGTKTVKTAQEWLQWPFRSEVKRVTYAPAGARVVDGALNLWPGWGCDPVPGDTGPWDALLAHLFTGEDEAREWFLDWLAYPLQHPGTKLYQACLLWGLGKGTGKSFIGYAMGAIYGQNFAEIHDRDLSGTFNGWAENKQFILGEEITAGAELKRSVADRMKALVTQKQLQVNQKYVPAYFVPDCVNYYFTSNHPDAFFVEDQDRRYFIHEVKGGPLPDAFYATADAWLRGTGPSHLFHALLQRDLSSFNPRGAAMVTGAKRAMTEQGRSDLEAWCAALAEDPDSVLRIGDVPVGRSLATSSELLRLFDPTGMGRVSTQGMGRALARAGVRQAYGGEPIHTAHGSQRLWQLRPINGAAHDHGELAALYNREHGLPDPTKKPRF